MTISYYCNTISQTFSNIETYVRLNTDVKNITHVCVLLLFQQLLTWYSEYMYMYVSLVKKPTHTDVHVEYLAVT